MNGTIQFRRIVPNNELESTLEDTYKKLGNPFVMIDTSYNLLANTQNTVSNDSLWNELTTTGRFSHETVDFFNKANFIQAFADSEDVALMRNDNLQYDRACATLFDKNGIQMGSITVVACYRPFRDEDFAEMENSCKHISDALQKSSIYETTERVYYDAFISDLLENRLDENDEELQAVRKDLKPYLFLLAVDVSRYEHTLSHLAYFRDLFSRIQGEFKYYLYLDNIVIIASAEAPGQSIYAALQPLHTFFSKYNIFAGLSESFQSLLDARDYYRQALAALNYGMNSKAQRRISKYNSNKYSI